MVASFFTLPQDAKQALRLRRFLMASGTYATALLLMALLTWQGFMVPTAYFVVAVVILVANAVFYTLLRTGVNLRFADPSLTAPQIFVATLMLMAMLYYTREARGALLMLYLVAFVFGVFRLRTRQFLFLGGMGLVVYGAVIVLRDVSHPETLNLRLELVQWLALAFVLPWFAFLGGYISNLRHRLNEGNRELQHALATIRNLATRDELTGVANRRCLLESLEQEKGRADRLDDMFCICILDLDFFKSINDTYGHRVGDQVLQRFAQTVAEKMRAIDSFGRYGGEEFVMILSRTTVEAAVAVAERIRQATAKCWFPDVDPNLRLTVSIGVSSYRRGEDSDAVIERADLALYKAKSLGRNRVELEA